jgi:hypothetical protein
VLFDPGENMGAPTLRSGSWLGGTGGMSTLLLNSAKLKSE